MESHKETQPRLKPYKVILTGAQGVGKSSLLERIVHAKFRQHYETTIGVDFSPVKVPLSNKEVVLQVWDTAGQEKFKALTASYFKGSDSCVTVIDLQQEGSLRKAQEYINTALQYQINRECVYLLGNKSDEGRQIEQQAKSKADSMQINYQTVSAKTGEGVGEFVKNLATKLDCVLGHSSERQRTSPTILVKEEQEHRKCTC